MDGHLFPNHMVTEVVIVLWVEEKLLVISELVEELYELEVGLD